uniref:Gypsy retrotransposon integrase-like protein 1 n=1 Tax=Acanthochromis polyacanthus TaxID=80966 RepID=A0A3Q1EK56_9TELE
MTGAKYFSKMDASNGFWQLRLDEESTRLCTFNTPYGRYSYQRLPFGISSAPEIFHRAMEQVIEGLEGVRVYVDDLVCWGSSQEEHDTRLVKTLQRIRQYGLKLNKDKCRFGVSEITFLGDKITVDGVQPDKTKVQAVLDMEMPKDKKGVQRALGLVNFLGRFIQNLAVKTTHLRKLLRRETEFQWEHEHEREWKELLEVLASEPLLAFFSPDRKTKVSTDASKDGLGAVLLQEDEGAWRPVAYASRSMTATECRYAQIEKECLGLAFGCEKFHTYIYGLHNVILETDHKPLLGIAKKNLCDMSPRIQRLMMRLQRYDFELIYTPGTQMFIADALSRAAHGDIQTSGTEKDIAVQVDMVYAALPATQEQLTKIAAQTAEDPVLRKVMKNLQDGWKKGSCVQYYPLQSELSVVEGLLLKGDRIVVPTSMRREMLQRIHEGHLGAEKSKRRAREALYWPNMNSDIDRITSECATCQEFRYKQTKEPLIPTEI